MHRVAVAVLASVCVWTSAARARSRTLDLRQATPPVRRALELPIHVAPAVGGCDESCGELSRTGFAAGAAVLVRLEPAFAFGMAWERAWFGWKAERQTVHLTFFGPVLRYYPVTRGIWDPWIECRLAIPRWGSTGTADAPYTGPVAMGLGAGLDAFVLGWLKLGPRIHADGTSARSDGPTSGGGAPGPVASPPATVPPLGWVVQLGVAVTLSLGTPVQRN